MFLHFIIAKAVESGVNLSKTAKNREKYYLIYGFYSVTVSVSGAPGPLTEWHRRLPVDLHNARKDVTQFFRLPFYSIHSLPLPATKSVVAVPKVTPDEMTRDFL